MAKSESLHCHICGEEMIITENGTSHHVNENLDIDFDADTDHTPYSLDN